MECDCTLTREEVSRGRKGCGESCLNRILMIECGANCTLGRNCANRKFQTCENSPVEIFKTEWKGFGLRAMKELQP